MDSLVSVIRSSACLKPTICSKIIASYPWQQSHKLSYFLSYLHSPQKPQNQENEISLSNISFLFSLSLFTLCLSPPPLFFCLSFPPSDIFCSYSRSFSLSHYYFARLVSSFSLSLSLYSFTCILHVIPTVFYFYTAAHPSAGLRVFRDARAVSLGVNLAGNLYRSNDARSLQKDPQRQQRVSVQRVQAEKETHSPLSLSQRCLILVHKKRGFLEINERRNPPEHIT